MKPSENLKELHIIVEGKKEKAYKCPAGVLTIGIGHTSQEIMPFNEKSVWGEDEINRAWNLDLSAAVEAACNGIKNPVSQGMFDATVDLIFNCGPNCRTYLNMVNTRQNEAAELALLRWIHVSGKASVGLIKRRLADVALFRGLDTWRDIASCNVTSRNINPLNELVAPMGFKVVPDSQRDWAVIQIDRVGNEV